MSLDKAIEHKKEHRKPYRGAKAVDTTCRNHGSCLWCANSRVYKYKAGIEAMRMEEEYWRKEEYWPACNRSEKPL